MTTIIPHCGIKREPLRLDVAAGISLDAELTVPADLQPGGKRPAVLLLPGQGHLDMDESAPSWVTTTGQPSKIFRQIADTLTDAGFIVLRYNKRGVIGHRPKINLVEAQNEEDAVWKTVTSRTIVQDARVAVDKLRQDPRVSDVSLFGHSEGTCVASALAATYGGFQSIMLMGVLCNNRADVDHRMVVDEAADAVWSAAAPDGSNQVPKDQLSTLPKELLGGRVQPPALLSKFDRLDTNHDGCLSRDELQAGLEQEYQDWLSQMNSGGDTELLDEYPKGYWRSWYEQPSNVSLLSHAEQLHPTPVLIWQGEADIRTDYQQEAVPLFKALSARGVDVTLLHYPGLGHSLSPPIKPSESGWPPPGESAGPIVPQALDDLRTWAVDRLRKDPMAAGGKPSP